MTKEERLAYIKLVATRGEMIQFVDPDEGDLADEFANLVRNQGVEDDINDAVLDAVFEGG
jgi:hypothetical protein